MIEERMKRFIRNSQYGKFASGDPRIDSRAWTGLKPRTPLRVHWFRFRMWFCQDCLCCNGDGRVMMQTGMSEYSDVECDVCHGRRTRFTWPRAVAYYGLWPFMLLGRLQIALWERALQWRYGPCPVCKGSGRERLGVPYVELPVVCSMCEGAGHRLAHDRMMEQIKADVARGGPGGCCCLECSLAKGYDV